MAPLLGFLALFLALCASLSIRLQLWGDEAYSLLVAARPLQAILAADPFHLPTYYLALHPLVAWFPPGREVSLRLLHAGIFAIGLVFAWRIARSLLGPGRALRGVMALTILLPNALFYATNIRMYAPLFAASLAFLWTAFRLLEPGGAKGRALVWHGLAALLCALIDWPGLLWVLLTWAALLVLKGPALWARRPRGGGWVVILAGLSLAALLAGLAHEPILRLLLEWPAARAVGSGAFSLSALAKTLFLQIRPLLDLVYPPAYPVAVNGLLWLLLLTAVPLAAAVVWRGGDRRERLVVVLAFAWLAGSPFGLAVTRAFLPSQFFALLTLALALQPGPRRRVGPLAPLFWACLLALGLANLQQALDPTLRLYSRIPYPAIAREAVAAASARQLPLIAVSRHTLNGLSVERFARPLLTGSQELRLLAVKPVCADFPRGRFLYVQLMPEDGEDSDPARACAGQVRVEAQTLRDWVPFAELGYNRLWSANLQDRGAAGVAARLRLVTIGGGADGAPSPG
ncbi:MAG: hypothetical protein VKO26_00280 [Cyanobacteriota bacterium]|nr:hypothetical protein [Cyanobacteriota bacterium]